MDPDDRLGRYLGFIDLRPNAEEAPLAMGLLAPPRHLCQDLDTFIATGEYGPLFGAHGFPCTAYSMHEPDIGGAHCAQACVLTSLVSLADRGAHVAGSYELTYLAKRGAMVATTDPDCIVRANPFDPCGSFLIDGLLPGEMEDLFNRCNTSACHLSFPDYPPSQRLAERLLAGYIEARYPAVLFVDSTQWWPWRAQTPYTCQTEPHAVTAVGFTRQRAAGNGFLASLVVHDPGFRPYYRRNISDCFAALKPYDDRKMHIVFVADAHIQRHAYDCVQYLDRSRLSSLWNHYEEGQQGSDYRIRLVHYDDLAATFFPSPQAEVRAGGDYQQRFSAAAATFRKNVSRLRRSCYWCIAAYDCDGNLDVLWLFDAWTQPSQPLGWSAFVDVSGQGEFRLSPAIRMTTDSLPSRRLIANSTVAPGPPSPPALAAHLDVSVLTSSSDLPLGTLFKALAESAAVKLFDLFILRDIDIAMIEADEDGHPLAPPQTSPSDNRCIADIMANDANVDRITNWLLRQCAVLPDLKIAALATYFPDVSSAFPSQRAPVVDALANTARLAVMLKQHHLMDTPIIELVCGSLLDRCDCDDCRDQRIWEYESRDKLTLLLESLTGAISKVKTSYPSEPFVFVLELEPGATYLLHDATSLRRLTRAIRSAEKDVSPHLALNVDVPHMHAAQVAPSVLEEPEQFALLAHAHACDLPVRMHTRDQPIGKWSPVDLVQSYQRKYLEVLARRKAASANYPVPFSGAVAVELEGCSRTAWIYQSVAKLREMIRPSM